MPREERDWVSKHREWFAQRRLRMYKVAGQSDDQTRKEIKMTLGRHKEDVVGADYLESGLKAP
jgi:hypothetical protein